MNSRIVLLSLLVVFSLCIGPSSIGREEYCEKVWKYDLECALNKTLSVGEIEKVSDLARSLRGINCAETAWKTLKWIQENVRYDVVKASLPPPIITLKGRDIIVQSPDRFYQTPEETARFRKGICGDIAILITALMLSNDCKTYVAFIDFQNKNVDHLASLVFLDRLYVLDQTLPPMDLGSYYNKWLREGKKIHSIAIYEKGVRIENLSAEELKNQNQEFAEKDLKRFQDFLVNELGKRFAHGSPERFKEKLIVRMSFEGLADYYTDLFSEKIAEMVVEKLLEKVEGRWDKFTLEIMANYPDIEVSLTLFRTL